jgi:superfamily II DNA helicase RecQ
MRNVKHVILWGLPPSFCALAQCSGRAGRDFEKLAKAIVIVSNSIIEKGITEVDVGEGVGEATADAQSQNQGEDEMVTLEQYGIDLDNGNQEVYIAEGVRVA